MNKKIYQGLATALLFGLAQVSSAENYSSELTGNYLTGDVDGQSANVQIYGVTQQVYLSEVDTSVGPLATAAFVSRASSYFLGYSELDDQDADIATAGIDWHDKETGLTFGLAYTFSDIDTDDSSSDQVTVSVGKYVGETTEVLVMYERDENKLNSDLVEEAYTLAISHVGTGDVDFAIDGSISIADKLVDDEQFGFAVAATLYPNRHLGLGAGFDIALADIDDDTVFAFAEWFFRPDVKGKATYYISDQDNVDITGLNLELSLRL